MEWKKSARKFSEIVSHFVSSLENCSEGKNNKDVQEKTERKWRHGRLAGNAKFWSWFLCANNMLKFNLVGYIFTQTKFEEEENFHLSLWILLIYFITQIVKLHNCFYYPNFGFFIPSFGHLKELFRFMRQRSWISSHLKLKVKEKVITTIITNHNDNKSIKKLQRKVGSQN